MGTPGRASRSGFVGASGFALMTAKVMHVEDSFCASCVLPVLLPFFIYRCYLLWRAVPAAEKPFFLFDPAYVPPDGDSGKTVSVLFHIPRRYTGLKRQNGNGAKISNKIFGSTFPTTMSLSDAFAKTVELVRQKKNTATLLEKAAWRFYLRKGLLFRMYLDPSATLQTVTPGLTIISERIEE
jgi:hypothetical protein